MISFFCCGDVPPKTKVFVYAHSIPTSNEKLNGQARQTLMAGKAATLGGHLVFQPKLEKW